MNIALTSVIVNDPMQAFQFYTQTLGFIERVYMPEERLFIVASSEQPEGTGLMLEPNDNPANRAFQQALHSQGIPVIVLGVTDMDKEVQRLKSQNVEFLQEPQSIESGIMAVFDDTCGNYIQIHQF